MITQMYASSVIVIIGIITSTPVLESRTTTELQAEIDRLNNDLNDIQGTLFRKLITTAYEICLLILCLKWIEIQELRHKVIPTTPSKPLSTTNTQSHLDPLLSLLLTQIESFSPAIQALSDQIGHQQVGSADGLSEDVRELQEGWRDALEDEERLKEELREDRWLVVFRQ